MPLRAPRGFLAEDDPKVAQVGHPAPPWLINYADLMTEMVAFFVIMYAFGAALNKDVVSAKKAVEEIMEKEKVEGKVEVKPDGLRIIMNEGGERTKDAPFFESGRAELAPRMIEILKLLAPRLTDLAGKNFDILVEGHTDNIPIAGNEFRSNWELSTARATVVVKYLVDNEKFPPSKIGAVGYGEYRPIVPNDSDANRRRNRRVVFFVKLPSPKEAEPLETPAPAAAPHAEEHPAAPASEEPSHSSH